MWTLYYETKIGRKWHSMMSVYKCFKTAEAREQLYLDIMKSDPSMYRKVQLRFAVLIDE